MAESLNIDNLNFSDDDQYSSTKRKRNQSASHTPKTPTNPSSAKTEPNGATDADSPRDAALRAELQSLQNINQVIEGVVSSLERAKANMDTVNRTVNHASTLLDTWTRILSQTEHNQRLILNPAWQGASQDLADAESETISRQRERERQEAEAAARREAQRLDEERRRLDAVARASAAAGSGTNISTGRAGGSLRGRGRAPSSGYGRTVSGEGTRGSQRGRPAGNGYGRVGSVGTRGGVGRGARGRDLT